MTRYQFNNEPLRILLASIASGLRPTDAFITSTLQKHLFREMKLADAAVKTPETLRWNPMNRRYAHTNAGGASAKAGDDGDAGEEDDMDVEAEGDRAHHASTSTISSDNFELPTKQNPVIVAIYGQICIAAKSYQSAICTLLCYFHAIVGFDAGAVYLPSLFAARVRLRAGGSDDLPVSSHRVDRAGNAATIRQSPAFDRPSTSKIFRHVFQSADDLGTQGLAFLSQYRNLRGIDPRTKREV